VCVVSDDGLQVGACEGCRVGCNDGCCDGVTVGDIVGAEVGGVAVEKIRRLNVFS